MRCLFFESLLKREYKKQTVEIYSRHEASRRFIIRSTTHSIIAFLSIPVTTTTTNYQLHAQHRGHGYRSEVTWSVELMRRKKRRDDASSARSKNIHRNRRGGRGGGTCTQDLLVLLVSDWTARYQRSTLMVLSESLRRPREDPRVVQLNLRNV